MVTASSVTHRLSSVWLATWPSASPVIRARAPSFSAQSWAIFIISLRMSTVVSLGGHFSYMASCISVNGTRCSFIGPL